jgi:hypothetical protein
LGGLVSCGSRLGHFTEAERLFLHLRLVPEGRGDLFRIWSFFLFGRIVSLAFVDEIAQAHESTFFYAVAEDLFDQLAVDERCLVAEADEKADISEVNDFSRYHAAGLVNEFQRFLRKDALYESGCFQSEEKKLYRIIIIEGAEVAFYRDPLAEPGDSIHFFPELGLADQDTGEQEAVVHLEIQEKAQLLEGPFVFDNLCLVDDDHRVFSLLDVGEHLVVQKVKKIDFGAGVILHVDLIEDLLEEIDRVEAGVGDEAHVEVFL